MKRLWQAVLEARQNGMEETDIFLDVTDTSSPYGEATVKNVYDPYGPIEGAVAVNPYYSYEAVFSHLIKPGRIPELTKFLCDLILHHLWEVDALAGMDSEEFYIRFLEEDIKNHVFGPELSLECFTEKEIRTIGFYYRKLCRTGQYEACFCHMLQSLYKNAWVNAVEDGSLVVVVNSRQSPEDEKRVKSIQNIFLQAGRRCHLYWEVLPGVVECQETTVENFVLF